MIQILQYPHKYSLTIFVIYSLELTLLFVIFSNEHIFGIYREAQLGAKVEELGAKVGELGAKVMAWD